MFSNINYCSIKDAFDNDPVQQMTKKIKDNNITPDPNKAEFQLGKFNQSGKVNAKEQTEYPLLNDQINEQIKGHDDSNMADTFMRTKDSASYLDKSTGKFSSFLAKSTSNSSPASTPDKLKKCDHLKNCKKCKIKIDKYLKEINKLKKSSPSEVKDRERDRDLTSFSADPYKEIIILLLGGIIVIFILFLITKVISK